MIKHGFKLFFRNIKKNKSTFLINIVGLSSGLVFAMFIGLWALDELNVDKFHRNDTSLFKVLRNVPSDKGISTLEHTPGLLATSLREEVPEISNAVSVVPPTRFSRNGILSVDEMKIKAGGQYVGNDYFNVFTCKFVLGSGETLFSGKYNVVITKSLATKLFGTIENSIGKVLDWDHEMLPGKYEVIGVMDDLPISSTEDFDVLFNYDLFLEKNPKLENWGNSDPATYIVAKGGTDKIILEKKIADFIQTQNPGSKETLFLQKYSDGYLYGSYENGKPAGGRITYVRLFSILGIFLLTIACINFINLATAKAIKRSKEVGIKKVLGASKKSLFLQYLGEAQLMTIVSAIAAIIILISLLPFFDDLTGKNLSLSFNDDLVFVAIGVIFMTGLLAGTYPALFLLGFGPTGSNNKKFISRWGELSARKVLVIFQFTISVVMIVGVLVVYNQTQLVGSKNLGYDRENIIYFEKGGKEGPEQSEQGLASFLNAVRNVPGVLKASNFRHSIVNRDGGTSDVGWSGKSEESNLVFTDFPAGYDFLETMGIEIKEGRSLSQKFKSPGSTVIFNETAIAQMGLKEPIGKIVTIWGEEREIIGVSKDFHFQSFYEEIKPLFFDFGVNPRVSNIIVKIQGSNQRETLERLDELYKQHNSGLAFEYSFLDNDYQKLYESENRASLLSQYLAGIAILISFLGIFGLAAFTTEKRRKEISVRKDLGQSSSQIIRMLSSEFAKLIVISILIATPITYFLAKEWLSAFAYRISLEVWYFIGSGLAVLIVAMFTVGFHAVRASNVNPAISLREE